MPPNLEIARRPRVTQIVHRARHYSIREARMKNRSASELRREFRDFFAERGHTAVPSSPLVPLGDPTLLFTTAGMVQFKPYFQGGADLPYTRAVSVQKCLRLSDLENVGRTPRHDTFFEMLGNFSFGDYFKAEAIEWAWELVTRTVGLPPDRLHVSVFNGEGGLPPDEEARELWRRQGVADARIVALGRKDNFWGPAGGTGACGPCSEIYYDLGSEACTCDGSCTPGTDCDRYMEFWNLVFPQYDAQPDGSLPPLPRPGIDTGMGLERLAMIVQGKRSIFETDLFLPVVELIAARAGLGKLPRLGEASDPRAAALCIIADHARALTFALAEGIAPGNEGRGYVLRRLLRRAARQGRVFGLTEPFLDAAAATVIERFRGDYPELQAAERRVLGVLRREEEAFLRTFEQGAARFETLVEEARGRNPARLDGEEVFLLHDTYGFLVDLTEEMARERGLAVDREGFERAMDEQRERARKASSFTAERGEGDGGPEWQTVSEGPDSEFIGWESTEAVSPVRRWRARPDVGDGVAEVILETTPFYPEGGGQVADSGRLTAPGFEGEMLDVRRADHESPIVHRVRVARGQLPVGEVRAEVGRAKREATVRNHTATHLLHAALRRVLGTHVMQAGSVVAPERLRFDYSHFQATTPEELQRSEDDVNRAVLANLPVRVVWSTMEEARRDDVIAFFGERYPSRVRSIRIYDGDHNVSSELCGGTHAHRTGDIGLFKILSDVSIAAGTRRIEAATGFNLVERFRQLEEHAGAVSRLLNARVDDLAPRVEGLLREVQELKSKKSQNQTGAVEKELAALGAEARSARHGRFVSGRVSAPDAKSLREAGDRLAVLVKPGSGVIWAEIDDRYAAQIVVSPELVKQGVTAGAIAKALGERLGVRGGGKDTSAQVGGKLDRPLDSVVGETWEVLATFMDNGAGA
jgi:alanyl-tRNA synthetase